MMQVYIRNISDWMNLQTLLNARGSGAHHAPLSKVHGGEKEDVDLGLHILVEEMQR